MAFRDALLKKIALDGLVRKIRSSLEADTGRVDVESLRRLLRESAYAPSRIRDLEVWMREIPGEAPDLVVLDNGLGRYRTDLGDLALRKSPTVKEMISLRNVRKILSDGDVLVSRRERTLDFLHAHCVGLLDLSWTREDITAMAEEGAVALEIREAEDVETVLLLFAELLGLGPAPLAWRAAGWRMYCAEAVREEGLAIRCLLAFSRERWRIFHVGGPLGAESAEDGERVAALLAGRRRGDHEGREVFSALMAAVLEGKG